MNEKCKHCGYRFNVEYEKICPICSADNSVGNMEFKQAKEIIKAGLTWANWADEQKKAMMIAYKSILNVESIKGFCMDCQKRESTIQPFEILDLLK